MRVFPVRISREQVAKKLQGDQTRSKWNDRKIKKGWEAGRGIANNSLSSLIIDSFFCFATFQRSAFIKISHELFLKSASGSKRKAYRQKQPNNKIEFVTLRGKIPSIMPTLYTSVLINFSHLSIREGGNVLIGNYQNNSNPHF